jgi:5-formyltetrahydrofolate cyclo-ligase
MLTKGELRRQLLERRSGLPSAYRQACSVRICQALGEWPAFQQAKTVMFYMPFRQEVDVRPAIETAWRTGKTVVLPRVELESRTMKLVRVKTYGELSLGAYGIWEPPNAPDRMVSPEEVELVVVPGVGFDRQGYRLGYGGGYYDRFFALAENAVRVGVAYPEQVVETVYPEAHDQSVHALITSRGTWIFSMIK